MSELYEKSLQKLELPQVLQLLSACAGSIGGKEACLRLSEDRKDHLCRIRFAMRPFNNSERSTCSIRHRRHGRLQSSEIYGGKREGRQRYLRHLAENGRSGLV